MDGSQTDMARGEARQNKDLAFVGETSSVTFQHQRLRLTDESGPGIWIVQMDMQRSMVHIIYIHNSWCSTWMGSELNGVCAGSGVQEFLTTLTKPC